MSGPATPERPTERPGAEDPSMEDILASIRRILSEDEAAAADPPTAAAASPTDTPAASRPEAPGAPRPDVLALDESMLVREPGPPELSSSGDLPAHSPSAHPPTPRPEQEQRVALPPEPTPPHGLVAPEAEAATTASMGALMRALTGGRPQPLGVTRAGVTLEDIVRDELRPMVKEWLDQHLPSLVERLVRAEIERVVGRATDL